MVFTTVPGVLKQINSYKRDIWGVNNLTDVYTATLELNGTAVWRKISGNYNLSFGREDDQDLKRTFV